MQEYDAMIIAPHPDDPEFGIGGTVAGWIREGRRVIYIILTNGNKGSDDPEITPEQLTEIRINEQKQAALTLGVNEVVFLGHDDQSLEDTPDFRKEVVKVIRTYRPRTVAAPDPYRKYVWHRDHRIAGQVVLDAVYPLARDRLAYPDLVDGGLLPHKVKELLFWGAEQPNYFSDVSHTWDLKIAALRCHKSQVGHFPKSWEDGFKSMHATRAKDKGYELAEAFYRVELPF
ncbi:MAG: PIG-L family deacetylase [Chloroflexi bacterium]|nr:PIG-L family deacetylase [Chloroflexota bacterium]